MEPAQAGGSAAGSSNNLKKWGPVAAIVLVIAAIVGIVVVTGGDDDDDGETSTTDVTTPVTEPTGTDAPTDTDPEPTEPGTIDPDTTDGGSSGEITFPLSFSQAQEQGIDVAWDERCDTEVGRLAIQWYFAPECYAPFEGDNGGATSRGVTADSIKVVVYQGPDDDPIINYLSDAVAVDDTNAEAEQTARDLLEMFQTYYEFYGRTIDLEYYVSTGLASDEVTARADAVRIAEDIQPFAVLGGPALTQAFADELAAREVLCVGCGGGSAEWYAERAPYVWGLAISAQQARAHAREYIDKQLADGNAVHAGDEAFQGQKRKFGLVYISSSDESEAINTQFAEELRTDGADVAEVLPYTLDPATLQSQASQIIAKLKASGVTSVITISDGIAPRDFTREATAQEYYPEWILVAPALSDVTAFGRTYDQTQWAHAFGITSNTAVRITPEKAGFFALYEWWKGTPPPAPDTIGVFMPNYTLFYAVTMYTGPELTPETWRDALFANEGTIAAVSQPFLSYGDKGLWEETDYSGVDDATLIWWDPNATGPDEIRKEGTGMNRFADGGARYLPGEWPTEDRAFVEVGAVAIFDGPPPGEEPRPYTPLR